MSIGWQLRGCISLMSGYRAATDMPISFFLGSQARRTFTQLRFLRARAYHYFFVKNLRRLKPAVDIAKLNGRY